MRGALALAAAVLVAGCLTPQEAAPPERRVEGALDEAATPEEIAALRERLAPYGALYVWGLEGDGEPLRYEVRGVDAASCDEVRAILDERPNVLSVGACRPVAQG